MTPSASLGPFLRSVRTMAEAENDAGACVRATTLREVITEALADAERTRMTGQTRDEWVAIAILASSAVPLHSHFPPEGGGPCPWCGKCVIPPASQTGAGR